LLMGAVEKIDVLDAELVSAVIADMAGKPFEYEAPLSAHGQVSEPLPELVSAETADEPEAVAMVEDAPFVIDAVAEAEVDVKVEADAEAEADLASAEVVFELPTASVIQLSAPMAADAVANAADAETTNALHARVERLEARVAQQDSDLRRVLALVIDWVEKDNQSLAGEIRNIRAA
jgi:general secretion pathway protein A